MGTWCRGACHDTRVGDLREAEQRGNDAAVAYFASDDHLLLPPMADVADQLETLVAIGSSCAKWHVALPMPAPTRPPYKPPTKWDPREDE